MQGFNFMLYLLCCQGKPKSLSQMAKMSINLILTVKTTPILFRMTPLPKFQTSQTATKISNAITKTLIILPKLKRTKLPALTMAALSAATPEASTLAINYLARQSIQAMTILDKRIR